MTTLQHRRDIAELPRRASKRSRRRSVSADEDRGDATHRRFDSPIGRSALCDPPGRGQPASPDRRGGLRFSSRRDGRFRSRGRGQRPLFAAADCRPLGAQRRFAGCPRLLRDYDRQSDNTRLRRVQELARLAEGEGVAGLCRIARFDRSPLVSRTAALAIIRPDERASCAPEGRPGDRGARAGRQHRASPLPGCATTWCNCAIRPPLRALGKADRRRNGAA